MVPRTRLGEVLFGLLFLAIALAILAGVLWTSFTYLYPPHPTPKSQLIHGSFKSLNQAVHKRRPWRDQIHPVADDPRGIAWTDLGGRESRR
jgi:hypothetical protein